MKAPRLARHGVKKRTEEPPLLPTLLAGLEGVVLTLMGARHARAPSRHTWGRIVHVFVRWRELICVGMAADPRERAGSARAR